VEAVDLVRATRGADGLAVVVDVEAAGVAFLRGDSLVGRVGFTSATLTSAGGFRAVVSVFLTRSLEAVGLEGDVTFFTVVIGFLAAVLAVGDFAVGDFAVGDFAVGDFAVGDLVVGDFVMGDLAVGDLAMGDLAVGDFATGDFAVGDVAAAVAATAAAAAAAVTTAAVAISAPGNKISDSMAARLSSDTGLKASTCPSGTGMVAGAVMISLSTASIFVLEVSSFGVH